MCAICGSVSAEPQPVENVLQMMKVMRHRGPDSCGLWTGDSVVRAPHPEAVRIPVAHTERVMGHTRLAIIDKGCDGQPYSSCDDRLHLVHNGEIYNYQELATLLVHEHSHRGESDSETVVHLLEENYKGDLAAAVRGVAPVLDGMVTMAVADERQIVVSRDSVGKKPIYYSSTDTGTQFASEKKALENPVRLRPGHMMILEGDERRILEFDRLRLPAIDIVDFDEAVALYEHVFRRAVRKRLNGLHEEAVGVIFSGGVDSVLIAHQLQQEGFKVRCYCAGEEDSGDVQAARWASDRMGLELRVRIIRPDEVERRLPEIIYAVEETGLLQVEVAIPMYFASEMAAEDGLKVVYTGQGADELQGGYDWYRSALAQSAVALHTNMWNDFRLLYDETLEREDKLTMAHSLEQRAPYLDRELIGESMRISPLLKIRGAKDEMRKWVHRTVAAKLGVPDDLAFRRKDPSQTGSGIHGVIERIAKRSGIEVDPVLFERNCEADKGSLYRYRNLTPADYGTPQARTLVETLAANYPATVGV